jgi:hypothetical protein
MAEDLGLATESNSGAFVSSNCLIVLYFTFRAVSPKKFNAAFDVEPPVPSARVQPESSGTSTGLLR